MAESKGLVWRDDDIGYKGEPDRLGKFIAVDQLFIKYGLIHTIAVIARDLHEQPELIEYIKANLDHIDVQLHAWEHIDYTQNHDLAPEQLKMAVKELEKQLGVRPTVFYPPWNRIDGTVARHARNLGLEVSFEHGTLENYVWTRVVPPSGVLNFHFWADEQVAVLEPAMQLYTGRTL